MDNSSGHVPEFPLYALSYYVYIGQNIIKNLYAPGCSMQCEEILTVLDKNTKERNYCFTCTSHAFAASGPTSNPSLRANFYIVINLNSISGP